MLCCVGFQESESSTPSPVAPCLCQTLVPAWQPPVGIGISSVFWLKMWFREDCQRSNVLGYDSTRVWDRRRCGDLYYPQRKHSTGVGNSLTDLVRRSERGIGCGEWGWGHHGDRALLGAWRLKYWWLRLRESGIGNNKQASISVVQQDCGLGTLVYNPEDSPHSSKLLGPEVPLGPEVMDTGLQK